MKYIRLAICLLLTQLAGLIGSFFTSSAISSWYATLIKPSFNPPNWLFGPVWILLYILMGTSAWLIWEKVSQTKKNKILLWLFWIHLVFNALWSIIFFGLKNPGLAFANILIIWIFIIILIIKFWSINKTASYLLVPYFLWVSFASVLNIFIWCLN